MLIKGDWRIALRQGIKKILNWIKLLICFLLPILQPLTSFSMESHKKALVKWLILVIAASAPVILTVLLTPVPVGDLTIWKKMGLKFTESMSVSEQFVYTAAFLAPTLYLVWEKFREMHDQSNSPQAQSTYDKFQKAMRVYKGYGWILFPSILIVTLTAICFGNIKTGELTAVCIDNVRTESLSFSRTFLYQILESYSWLIYAFSLYAFYLSIVQDYGPEGDYNDAYKAGESEVTSGLKDRVNRGGKQCLIYQS